ncbi:glycosyltransferase family 1 protein [Methanofollis formosanus]|uniref:Glycosyltransferase family 1 protein n=1 Tax=Methanofollis formosanus TaxID=299308 RepID=A0A8G1EHC7_9EURY|nr:glycosyltransferase family 4 protein [Methanofollis formosanus]QYZ79862.1 glycosyltransferase family 1 protein [Methanofollis formosanus]
MNRLNIGIITFPQNKTHVTPLYNLARIISCLADQVYVITGNVGGEVAKKLEKPHVRLIRYNYNPNKIIRIYNHAMIQLKTTFLMTKLSKKVDIWILIGGELMILPIMLTKITRIPLIIFIDGNALNIARSNNDPLLKPMTMIFMLGYTIVDNIGLYSPALISACNLKNYSEKIHIVCHHSVNFEKFAAVTPLSDRPLLIGYIGRLSVEKGVQNFARALPAILSNRQNLSVLIGGEGKLKEAIESSLQENGLTNRVDLAGWISHEDLPEYLNQLRLLVLPSYSEGLPNIMLEAMACGIPVLATPVGAIPDVVVDGETGFIMEDNSPECIEENVLRALSSPALEQIAENGKRFVMENFTFEHVVARWKEVIEGV